MKILGAVLGLLLLSAPLSAGIVFEPSDWDRVDTVIILMKRDIYQHEDLIVEKSFRRVRLTSVDTQDRFSWLFDANARKVYLGTSDDGGYWLMRDVDDLIKSKPDATQIIRNQLKIIESIVALVNALESK